MEFRPLTAARRFLAGQNGAAPARRSRTPKPTVESLEGRALMAHLHGVSALSMRRAMTLFQTTNLVSNNTQVVPALSQDPNLVNAWGIAASPSGPFWVADNGTGVSTLYNGAGAKQALVVTVPPPAGAQGHSAPTGIVFNGSTDFVVQSAGKSGASVFVFSTEDGTISGWSPGVNATNAILAVDNSASGAVYKGLAMAASSAGNRLYATNFHTRARWTCSTRASIPSLSVPALSPTGAFHAGSLPLGSPTSAATCCSSPTPSRTPISTTT